MDKELKKSEKDASKAGKKKREADCEDEEFGSKVQQMIKTFGTDVNKTLVAKRKRLEQYTTNTVKIASHKVDTVWKSQQQERQKITDEFCKQMSDVMKQCEGDVEAIGEQELALLNSFKQQQKLFQQSRTAFRQKLQMIKELFEQFQTINREMAASHVEQHSGVQGELKKEMALLQKKILAETQQHEVENVRKSLQSILH